MLPHQIYPICPSMPGEQKVEPQLALASRPEHSDNMTGLIVEWLPKEYYIIKQWDRWKVLR